ncbi:hypothetical protein [Bacillus sp. AK128]
MNNKVIEKTSENSFIESVSFTYHQKSGYVGIMCAMIFVALLETVGVSFLLYNWSPLLHWIHLILGVLTIVFIILDLRAVVKNPIRIQGNMMYLKIGVRPEVKISLENIEEIKNGNINFENDKKNKEVLDLSLLGLDEPTFEIVLEEPIEYKSFIGKTTTIRRIFFTVDEKSDFYNMINKYRCV